MNNAGKLGLGLAAIVVVGLAAAGLGGVFNNKQFTDSGVDVRHTKCEELASARAAIAAELDQRNADAQTALDATNDQISDDYWAKNRQLENEYHQCISRALTADPCKEAFEEVGRLYEEIMADFRADKGFNEAKFNEREAAKKKYNDCVEETHKPEYYPDKEASCQATLDAARSANQTERQTKEAAAQSAYQQALATAQDAYQQKSAILDAIAAECSKPGGTTYLQVGNLTTESTGTTIQANGSACTGIFAGNDPEILRQISTIEGQLQKARAGGEGGGLFGTNHLQEALDRLRQELRESERTCKTDADCGDPTPICCSGTTIGRVYCAAGICANEITECSDGEICAGKPAQCIAPETGGQSSAIYLERTIPEVGTCSQNLRVLDLQPANADSIRYEIVGNIPDWVNIDKPSGNLPSQVKVDYSCGTVQGFGPGNYTANGSILIKNSSGELINTIPLNISITVTEVTPMVDVIEYNGKYIPLDQVHRFSGPECDEAEHWHANGGSATALDGSVIPDTSDCGYGKTSQVPVISVPDIRLKIEVRGLESLKQ